MYNYSSASPALTVTWVFFGWTLESWLVYSAVTTLMSTLFMHTFVPVGVPQQLSFFGSSGRKRSLYEWILNGINSTAPSNIPLCPYFSLYPDIRQYFLLVIDFHLQSNTQRSFHERSTYSPGSTVSLIESDDHKVQLGNWTFQLIPVESPRQIPSSLSWFPSSFLVLERSSTATFLPAVLLISREHVSH